MAKTVLITGACGGLGRAAALKFASEGFHVFAADVSPFEEAENVTPVIMDVTSDESVEASLRFISGSCTGLDAIVHLAGLYTMDSFIEIEQAELSSMLEVNLMGVYRVNRAFLPLVQNAGGRIIIVASELAPLDPLPFNGIYSMTKRALDSYAHSLALELDLIGTKVITVYPGAYGDGMTKAAVRAMERMSKKTRLYPAVSERFCNIVLNETGAAKDPSILAGKLLRIINKKRPKFRYFMNNSFKLGLFSALPMGVQAFALRLLLKGKNEMNDNYADINAATIDRWVEAGWKWGVPIDHETYLRAKKGDWDVLLTPTKPVPHEWFGELRGKRLLGLASGGGQQAPIFAALGAEVTVFDYSEKQLESERLVAEREGYGIRIVRGDMTKRLPFEDEEFDIIFHPVSNCYVKDVLHVWRECARVLKKGGILLSGTDHFVNYIVDENEERIVNRLPFDPLENPEQRRMLEATDSGLQFSHTLEEQITGQLRAGFTLTDLYEDTNGEGRLHELNVPTMLAMRAIKADNN